MKKYLGYALQIGVGIICGTAMGELMVNFLPEVGPEAGNSAFILLIIIIMAGLVSGYLHILLHEGGHLVCGLLSGYRFVSFRVGNRILIKSNGAYHLKRFHIPGTGGQCLLDPPDPDAEGKYPVKLYNLGGGLANLLFAGLAAIGVASAENWILCIILLIFSAFGIILGLMNLIPLELGGIANDGHNILSLEKDKIGSKAFWQGLRINCLQNEGVRLSHMDKSLFDLAFCEAVENPLVDQMKLFYMQRLMDERRFDEARIVGEDLVANNTLQMIKNMAGVELLYLELIGPCRETEIKRLYDRPTKKWLKAVKDYPSSHRVKYAYAKRFAQDDKSAARAAADFEKTCSTYSQLGEIETEKMLFAQI